MKTESYELKGRVVVMGASSGMGREVARQLLRKGWRVGVAARRKEALDELCSEFPQQAVAEQIDVTNEDAAERLLSLVRKLGGMDVYVHSSGIGWQNVALDADLELRTVMTNGLGFTRMIDAAFRYFRVLNDGKLNEESSENSVFPSNNLDDFSNNSKNDASPRSSDSSSVKGGHIVAISSIAGTKGLGPAPSYSATKAFQNTYLEALEQLSTNLRLGISITDIRPGFVDTALIDGQNYPLKLKPQMVAQQIVKAIEKKRHVSIVDWRYHCLVAGWRLLPRCLWRRVPLCRA